MDEEERRRRAVEAGKEMVSTSIIFYVNLF